MTSKLDEPPGILSKVSKPTLTTRSAMEQESNDCEVITTSLSSSASLAVAAVSRPAPTLDMVLFSSYEIIKSISYTLKGSDLIVSHLAFQELD
jgi:hypothetical protein